MEGTYVTACTVKVKMEKRTKKVEDATYDLLSLFFYAFPSSIVVILRTKIVFYLH